MKIHYKHLLRHINSQPTINELSEKLFQLGHEHDIDNDVFDIEFTPNRGDCLSIIGLLRDLNLFYDTQINLDIYQHNIEPYPLNFTNNVSSATFTFIQHPFLGHTSIISPSTLEIFKSSSMEEKNIDSSAKSICPP